MNIEDVQSFCLSLKGTIEDIKWDTNLTFLVSDKIFAMTSLDAVPTRLSIKVLPEVFSELLENENMIQAPYLAKGQWVNVIDISLENKREIKELIEQSYNLIKAKLTKKKQAEIDALED